MDERKKDQSLGEDLAAEEIFSRLRQTLADEERLEMIAAYQLDAHLEDEDLYLWEKKG
jgi:hypothetical protein